ncbi:type VII secretion protein EccCa [Arachnia propionica]|uniref:type VII secretion protein EccCa n=1 Tax=Arachnia propionica TaxID=1750 RepID=UPI0021AB8CE2|nr:type VII secretion protein EccCa [Arachnia propionica]
MRPTRDDLSKAPELPSGTIEVQSPPDQVEAAGMGNVLAMALPMMGSMGVMVFMAFSQTQNTRMLLMAGGMVFAMLGMVGFNIHRQVATHRRKVDTTRREYLAYLTQTRATVRTAARRQRDYVGWHLPEPDSLVLITQEGSRLWERQVSDETATQVRIGSSTQPLSMELVEPELPPLAKPDVVCLSAMRRFIDTHATVERLPFGVMLGDFSRIEVAGDASRARASIRAMIAHGATLSSPDLLRVAVLCDEAAKKHWEWVKWLPHARSEKVGDALGGARMVTSDLVELTRMLGEEFLTRGAFQPRGEGTPWPQLMLVLDGVELPALHPLGRPDGVAGVSVVTPVTSWGALTSRFVLRLILRGGDGAGAANLELLLLDQQPIHAVPDLMEVPQAEAVARRMVAWTKESRPETDSPVGKPDPKRSQDLMELIGCGDIRDFDPERRWRRREGRDLLRVPFGVTPEGAAVVLDIKESAQQGMGPHGLLIGATGSGKSEVLRTLVLAMALTHGPDQLNFVLVDFKGGATFAGMADLPHVSAMISNLESELSLVDRMQEALRGEMVRRQELLRRAGNYANVTDYEQGRLAGVHDGPPLPVLFIILDEFSELLSAKPEFVELFVAIGRLGRSMAIHLLLSSQRLESGRLRGLDSHLSYRIGLRTFSGAESREVLGVTDAYDLPPYPGVGYLKTGTEQMVRFRASYVAAPPPARRGGGGEARPGGAVQILPFTTGRVDGPEPTAIPEELPVAGDDVWRGRSQIDIAVARMKGHGTPAHQIWLPPLEVPATFDELMPDLVADPVLGLHSPSWRAKGPLRFPAGVVDLPLEQRRDVLEFDLSGAKGHFGVIGGPLAGKSTVLRSVVMALSLTHTPQEVQFYIIDLGGGTFTPFEGAAHVAGVASRDRRDVMNRMLAEVEALIDDRERFFRQHRIDSMESYRTGRAEGRFDDGYGDVFLVVDGWATLKTDFEGMDGRIIGLMGRALSFGVHVMVATSRWMDMRQQVADALGSRVELRLGDSFDSQFDRKVAGTVPHSRPGRGQDAGHHHVLSALPRIDGDPDPGTLVNGVTHALAAIAEAAPSPGPKLRLLPTMVSLDEVRALSTDPGRLALGVEETRLGAWTFDPRREGHLFVFGDGRCGKTSFLRGVVQEVMRLATPDQAQFFVVDYRRSLLGDVPEEYLAQYLTNPDQTEGYVKELAQYLRSRLPGAGVTTKQLRERSWWRGAEGWIIVDDYDLVATQSGNPLAVLQPLLAQALDIGFHVVIARRMGGASRAMYDPLLQGLRDLDATGLMMSGNPDEGMLLGRAKPSKLPAGRAQVFHRDLGHFMAQLPFCPPVE